MPRPGYEPEDDGLDNDSVLTRFDPKIRAELETRLKEGSISDAHVLQVYRLITMCPEERDEEAVAELLDATDGMAEEEFKRWVDDRIARWKE